MAEYRGGYYQGDVRDMIEDDVVEAINATQQYNDDDFEYRNDIVVNDERHHPAISVTFPQEVSYFLRNLYQHIYHRNVDAIRRLYEIDYNEITEKYYSSSRWPSVSGVTKFYQEINEYHALIMTFYKELYFRHVFDKMAKSIAPEERFESWENYYLLLDYFLGEECKPRPDFLGLKIPPQWLWDILDEYVYQFQVTQRWRSTILCDSGDNERVRQPLEHLKTQWTTSAVFNTLHQFVADSKIKSHLKEAKDLSKQNSADVPIPHYLGYFAMISQLRLHVMFGNYREALESVSDLDFGPRALYMKVPACHITLIYNIGFSYMMLGRFQDAIRSFSTVLMYINRNRYYTTSKSYQQDTMNRLIDKMYILTMLCNALSPNRLDDSILQYLKEKYADKLYKLQQDDDEIISELFTKAAPKFIHGYIPSLSEMYPSMSTNEPNQRQLRIFLREVQNQRRVSNFRSFAKLYNNIPLEKLTSLMQADSIDTVRSEMMAVKNKGRQRVWRSGNLLSGELTTAQYDLEFYLDGETIHVNNNKVQRSNAEWFIKQVTRTQDLLDNMGASVPPSFGPLFRRHPPTFVTNKSATIDVASTS